jgi:hypothetical protein
VLGRSKRFILKLVDLSSGLMGVTGLSNRIGVIGPSWEITRELGAVRTGGVLALHLSPKIDSHARGGVEMRFPARSYFSVVLVMANRGDPVDTAEIFEKRLPLVTVKIPLPFVVQLPPHQHHLESKGRGVQTSTARYHSTTTSSGIRAP